MKNESIDLVREFHEVFEHPVGDINTLEPLKIRQLRIKLLFEELEELARAGDVKLTFHNLCLAQLESDIAEFGNDTGKYGDTNLQPLRDGDNVNQVEELDALTDLQYVLDGKKLTSGLYVVADPATVEVHGNNMAKAHRSAEHVKETGAAMDRLLECKERKGLYIALNESGKVIKPHDHKKVDLSYLVRNAKEGINAGAGN